MNESHSTVTAQQLVAALTAAESDLEVTGWGDQSTRLYVVVQEDDEPWFALMAKFDDHPNDVIDAMIDQGHGLGTNNAVVGVVCLSEGWRHLFGSELREAMAEDMDALTWPPDSDEDWDQLAALMAERTRPRDMPDHMRSEVRIAVCVMRDDRLIQVVRDRATGGVEVDDKKTVSGLPERTAIPRALARLLGAPEMPKASE